jgi:hypothetical protein
MTLHFVVKSDKYAHTCSTSWKWNQRAMMGAVNAAVPTPPLPPHPPPAESLLFPLYPTPLAESLSLFLREVDSLLSR